MPIHMNDDGNRIGMMLTRSDDGKFWIVQYIQHTDQVKRDPGWFNTVRRPHVSTAKLLKGITPRVLA